MNNPSEKRSLFEQLGADILARMFEVAAHGLALTDAQGRFLHLNARGCAILGEPYDRVLERTFLEYVATRQQAAAEGWFLASLGGTVVAHDFTIVQPGGRECEVSAFGVPVSLANQDAALIALHDVTEPRRAEREARVLARIVSSLALQTSIRAISQTISEWVVKTTAATAGAVVLFSHDSVQSHVTGSFGLGADAAPLEPLLTHNLLSGDQAVYTELSTPWSGVQGVPLRYRGERVGALLSFYPPGYAQGADTEFLQAIADQSAFAVQNARLFADMQSRVALEERQRLARELHDSVSQSLYGIALGARSARSQLPTHLERVGERLDYVLKLAESGITEMRALIFELRPETLATEGLVSALNKQTAALQARCPLEIETSLPDEPEFSMVAKEALYRIAQEALHNIFKHAQAKRVSLTLKVEAQQAVLEITDDGVGFAPDAGFPGHLGLSSMRERAELLGGSLELDSAPGRGTTLRATLPLGKPYPVDS